MNKVEIMRLNEANDATISGSELACPNYARNPAASQSPTLWKSCHITPRY